MEIKDLTEEIVTPIIEQVVAEFGEDYKYAQPVEGEGCLYIAPGTEGEPSCLVGHVLHRAGVTLQPIWDMDGLTALRVLEDAPNSVRRGLQQAQQTQDLGRAWGEALRGYRKVVADYHE